MLIFKYKVTVLKLKVILAIFLKGFPKGFIPWHTRTFLKFSSVLENFEQISFFYYMKI